jgi:5-methylcytosine-specific restriction endonuclease McrA
MSGFNSLFCFCFFFFFSLGGFWVFEHLKLLCSQCNKDMGTPLLSVTSVPTREAAGLATIERHAISQAGHYRCM